MTAELRACPFCGGEAEVERMGDRGRSCIITCTECGCRLETGEENFSCGQQWNRRADPPPPPTAARGEQSEGICAEPYNNHHSPDAQTADGWRLVPVEPTAEMIRAADTALADWRKTLDRDEAMMRSYRAPNGGKFVASATPAEKHAIRWRAMLTASPAGSLARGALGEVQRSGTTEPNTDDIAALVERATDNVEALFDEIDPSTHEQISVAIYEAAQALTASHARAERLEGERDETYRVVEGLAWLSEKITACIDPGGNFHVRDLRASLLEERAARTKAEAERDRAVEALEQRGAS